MNLTSILTLLQIALGLLSNPAIQANPVLMNQATDFANQAVVLAVKATEQLQTSSLLATSTIAEIPTTPTSSQTFYIPTNSTSSEIYIPVSRPVEPSFGAIEVVRPTFPTMLGLSGYDSNAFQVSGGDYDSFKLTCFNWFNRITIPATATTSAIGEQGWENPTDYVFDRTSAPDYFKGQLWIVKGLDNKESHKCILTATKGDAVATSSTIY